MVNVSYTKESLQELYMELQCKIERDASSLLANQTLGFGEKPKNPVIELSYLKLLKEAIEGCDCLEDLDVEKLVSAIKEIVK